MGGDQLTFIYKHMPVAHFGNGWTLCAISIQTRWNHGFNYAAMQVESHKIGIIRIYTIGESADK